MEKIAAVILNYNSYKDTEQCVLGLKRQKEVDITIIIVDNCSHTPNELKELNRISHATSSILLSASSNRGYNAGNNIGIKYAITKGFKYVLIANPDMIFNDSLYLSKLYSVIKKHYDIAVIGSDILTPEGHHQNPISFKEEHFFDNFSWIRNLIFPHKEKSYNWNVLYTKSGICSSLNGCCLLISIDFLKTIGCFDERIFLFGEERILSQQVKKNKYKMYYYGEVQAIHNHKQKKEGNQWKRLKILRKSEMIYLKYYSDYNCLLKTILWLQLQLKYLLLFIKYGNK